MMGADPLRLNRRRSLALLGAVPAAALGAGFGTPRVDPVGALPPLDLSRYEPSFVEDFDGPLDVTAWGPSRWIAHTPWNGDFGAARFTDPGPGQAWSLEGGVLSITARQNGPQGGWTSALLSSSDRAGQGFRQALGYFEARMRFPLARGVWPAFWLMATHPNGPRVEVDVVEFYGRNTAQYRSVVHLWPNHSGVAKQGAGHGTPYVAPYRPDDFNLYGAEVGVDTITMYFNRQPVWRTPAPVDMRSQPLTLLVNLAIEAGAAPGEHRLHVDHVRAWALR